MDKQVFISFHEDDAYLVNKLDGDLQKAGVRNIWISTRNLKPGKLRRQQIFEGIVASDSVVVCLSPSYLNDEFCRTQLYLARTYAKQISPVLVSRFNMPPISEIVRMGQQHRHDIKGIEDLSIVDLSENYDLGRGSYEKNFQALMEALDPAPEPVPLNPQLIFMGYGWPDRDFADKLTLDLKDAGALVWFDKYDIRVGDSYQKEMNEAITTARYYILCLSDHAARSEFVKREVLIAQLRGITILPVIPERVAASRQLLDDLNVALRESEEMNKLADVTRFEPNPNYETLLANLRDELGLDKPEPALKQGIFISYRRADSQATTGRIYSELVRRFSRKTVFKDVDTIPAGTNFVDYFTDWLETKAAIVLVMIGPKWAIIKPADKPDDPPRLHDPQDYVRLEVALSLQHKDILVIPVFVDEARMPEKDELPTDLQELTSLNGISVRPDPDFENDMRRLISAIEQSQTS